MIAGKHYKRWPGFDDRCVVEEMLNSPRSEHWAACRDFVRDRVSARAANLPYALQEDVVQDAMVSVQKSLPTFQYQCRLETWLLSVVKRRIIDAYRKQVDQAAYSLDESSQETEHETTMGATIASPSETPEEISIEQEELREALSALTEYVSMHANPVRNKQILEAAIIEGRSLEEAAKIAGCSAPVAGYIVRSAQRFVREKLKFKHEYS